MNPITQKLIGINLTGNIIPMTWFNFIKKGKREQPDLLAINILADILYWYRPSEVRDESTGRVIGYKQKFRSDKLQKSYASYAKLFGFSKERVKQAFDLLVDLGLITREFRNIKTEDYVITNVMFIEPVIDKIFEITKTVPEQDIDTTYDENSSPPPPKKDPHPSEKKGGTNTKITTEITTYKYINSNNISNEKNFEFRGRVYERR